MGFEVRIVDAPSHDWILAGEISALTGWDPVRASALLKPGALIAEGLERDAAERLSVLLRAAGAEVKVVQRWRESQLALDPDRGADQRLVEVFRAGKKVGLRHFGFGEKRGRIRAHDTPSAAQAKVKMAHYIGTRTSVASEWAAYDQIAARDRALEGPIVAAPEDDAPRLVYADWLMEQGDMRGEHILNAVEGEMAEDYGRLMLGPANALIKDQKWDRGLLIEGAVTRRVLIDHDGWRWFVDSFAALVVQQLEVDGEVAEAIVDHLPASLSTLQIALGRYGDLSTAVLDRYAARLTSLSIVNLSDSHRPEPITFRSERLRSLAVESTTQGHRFLQDFLRGAALPNLEQLTLLVAGPSERPPFLSLRLPALRRMKVAGNFDLVGLAEAPVFATVTHLQINLGYRGVPVERLQTARPRLGDRRVELLLPEQEIALDPTDAREAEAEEATLRAAGYEIRRVSYRA